MVISVSAMVSSRKGNSSLKVTFTMGAFQHIGRKGRVRPNKAYKNHAFKGWRNEEPLKNVERKPIRKAPIIFTMKVPQGKNCPPICTARLPVPYLLIAPRAPPRAIAINLIT
jgi:hypothetical protein